VAKTKLSWVVLALVLLLAGTASAQVIAGSAVNFTSKTTIPASLVTGIWNHSGTLTLKCDGCTTILSAPGIVESTIGGFKFPDATVQTTAANFGANALLIDPDKWASDTIAQCAGGHAWYANPASRATTSSATRFQVLLPATITGVRFFSAVTAASSYVCRVWNFNGVSGATGSVSTTGVGHYQCNFSSPVSFSLGVGKTYKVSVYGGDTGGGTTTTRLESCSGSMPVPGIPGGPSQNGGPNLMWGALGDESAGDGDTFPNVNSSNVYVITPVFTVP